MSPQNIDVRLLLTALRYFSDKLWSSSDAVVPHTCHPDFCPQRTPLHEAARHGQSSVCALLLKRGAKRDVMDIDANEPGEDFESSVLEQVKNEIRKMIEAS